MRGRFILAPLPSDFGPRPSVFRLPSPSSLSHSAHPRLVEHTSLFQAHPSPPPFSLLSGTCSGHRSTTGRLSCRSRTDAATAAEPAAADYKVSKPDGRSFGSGDEPRRKPAPVRPAASASLAAVGGRRFQPIKRTPRRRRGPARGEQVTEVCSDQPTERRAPGARLSI